METPSDSTSSDKTYDAGADARRPRAILSCIACRDKKLKCDRGKPCNNCSRRHHTCRYFSSAQPGRNVPPRPSNDSELNRRLQHLEELLVVLNDQQAPDSETDCSVDTQSRAIPPREDTHQQFPDGFTGAASGPQLLGTSDRLAGSMLIDKGGTAYVEASHWQSILDDIQDVREFLQQNQTVTVPSPHPSEHNRIEGPALLFSGIKSRTKEDFIVALPPRATVDRLVSRFFNSGEPAIMIVHVPTFLKEYEAFWINPGSVPIAWLGLLYSALCMGVFFHARSEQPLPSPLGAVRDVLVEFQARTAQCIQQSDYTRTGKYKLEALLTYLGIEYFLSSDAQLGVSVCLSIIIRMAMHMGVHRDSDQFKNISLFEGEMRRRAWALLSQVERLTSFQMGLPSMIDRSHCSTQTPHNYQDADIHEDMTRMPPERPVSERTVVSYTIGKDRMINAFGNIVDAVCGNASPSYDTITSLDTSLERAQASLPPYLQMRSMSLSFTDSADIIMQRYNIELLYLKARCVLHRQYMTQSTSNPRFAGSRAICVDAARRTLRHQADIHLEAQPGGQLHQDRWFISSLTTSDFLLASMILCLELSRRVFESDSSTSNIIAEQSSKEIIDQLKHSRQIWLDSMSVSRDAGRASDAIASMLQSVEKASQTPVTPITPGSLAEANCRLTHNAAYARDEDAGVQGYEHFLNAHDFDWQSWDMAILRNEANAESLLVDMPQGGDLV